MRLVRHSLNERHLAVRVLTRPNPLPVPIMPLEAPVSGTDLLVRQDTAPDPIRQPRTRSRRRPVAGSRPAAAPRSAAEPRSITEDAVLRPVSGIVEVFDSHALVHTTGYVPDADDVYVSATQVKRFGLRTGDLVVGTARAGRRENTDRNRHDTLAGLDSVNGLNPDALESRPDFYRLTPIHPQERLRLETDRDLLTGRVIDLVAPLGKGQRALIVSPPKAGKTLVLQAIAAAVSRNHPDCHLMAVLVDERPEEVTDMVRSVKGEVIASPFDRPPRDHIALAELAIERAKRLVELGHDVVVLLDSLTRLGRAYNLAAPAGGRTLTGGIDSTALYPPKRFLGAARNIEDGGSLTIMATALVETGSMLDTVIFEELKSTGNAELKLDRKSSDKRVFPAIDVEQSGTRMEEILLAPDELAIVRRLRRAMTNADGRQALEQLLDQLGRTSSNAEFLVNLARSTAR